jgi:hypothetical protein
MFLADVNLVLEPVEAFRGGRLRGHERHDNSDGK